MHSCRGLEAMVGSTVGQLKGMITYHAVVHAHCVQSDGECQVHTCANGHLSHAVCTEHVHEWMLRGG